MNNHPGKGTIEFDQVSKRYRLGTLGALRGTISALLSRGGDSNDQRHLIWALRDLSFRLVPGESLGLIGPNGAGKTTTLKLLSSITKPTTGQITVQGRVSSLIELGAGFHPELTGRENIFLNGAILGLRRHEVARKLEAIVAFSELERFIDTPVKRYSSGMYVRLGFAVAAHVEPDILLVDEVLAVGDASFRHRCIQHMQALREKGTTVVFVSHNMHLVRNMCERVMLLIDGQLCADGEPARVIAEYERALLTADPLAVEAGGRSEISVESQAAMILTAAEVVPGYDHPGGSLESHLPVKLRIHYRTPSTLLIGRVDVRIMRDDGTLCCTADSSQSPQAQRELNELAGSGVIEVVCDPLQLTTGKYVFMIRITDASDNLVIASAQSDPFYVHANGSGPDRGIFVPQVSWRRYTVLDSKD